MRLPLRSPARLQKPSSQHEDNVARRTVIDTLRHSAIEASLAVATATTGLAGCSPEPSAPGTPITSEPTAPASGQKPFGNESFRGLEGSSDLHGSMRKLAYAASTGAPFDEKLAREVLKRAVDDYALTAPDEKSAMRENGISYSRKVVAGNKQGHTSSVVIINPQYQSLAVFSNIQYEGVHDPVLDMSAAKRAGAIAQDPTQHIEQTYAETAALLLQHNENAAAQYIRDHVTRKGDIAKLPQRYVDMLAGEKEAMQAFSVGSGVSADFTVSPLLNKFVQSYTSPVAIRREGDELVARVQDMDTHIWTDAGKVSIAPKQAKGFGERVNDSRTTQREPSR